MYGESFVAVIHKLCSTCL